MQETVFYRTCSLLSYNQCRLANDIRKWLPHASVYVQNHPLRVAICYGSTATIINETDIFSFVQRYSDNGKVHDIINHSEKQGTVKVSIGKLDFLIETFTSRTVEGTENMRFRLTCLTELDLSGDFDDYEAVKDRLNEFLWEAVEGKLCI